MTDTLSAFLSQSGVSPEAAVGLCARVQARMQSRAELEQAPVDAGLQERVDALEMELQAASKQLREQREEMPRLVAQRLEQQQEALNQSLVCVAPAPASVEATAAEDTQFGGDLDYEVHRIAAIREQARAALL
jgi:membrane protein involved in colicin uptake